MGKPSINGPFSMAMLNNHRVQHQVPGKKWCSAGASILQMIGDTQNKHFFDI